jgi:diguanylate cyclase (GGDEF)-like protein
MALFEFLPKDNPRQRLRIKRFLMGLVTYLIGAALLVYCVSQYLLPRVLLPQVLTLMIVGNISIYAMLRSHMNLKFADPSLTIPQMLLATLIILFVLYYANEVRGALLMLLMVTFVFGLFQLNTRQFMAVGCVVVLGYALMIWVLYEHRRVVTDFRVEFMHLALLACVMPWFAWLGGYIADMRVRLKTSNAELHVALGKIQRMVSFDELTGIYNRRYLVDFLSREINRASLMGHALSVMMLDIDYFKRVNDSCGHSVGDAVLREFAEAVQLELRSTDCFGRYGGEEFLLLLPDTSLAAAGQCAERIRLRVGLSQLGADKVTWPITVSIGVTQFAHAETLAQCIDRADEALYAAKAGGRNRVELRPAPVVSASPGSEAMHSSPTGS